MILNPTSSYRLLNLPFLFHLNSQITPFLSSCCSCHTETTLQGDHWPLLFLNLMDTFSPFYLTWWQPLLLPTTSLLKCSTAFISLIFDSVPLPWCHLWWPVLFPLLVPLLELTVKGISGERLGGTAVLTMTVSIYLQLASVRSVCR